MESRIQIVLLAVALAATLPLSAKAQETPPTPRPPSPPSEASGEEEAVAPRLDQSPLQLWLQPDKNGALVPVPVFAPDDEGDLKQHVLSWSDIDRLLDRLADQQSPRVSCQRLVVNGAVNGNRAYLEIDMTFLTSPQRWVRAPLGLSSAAITSFESPTGGFLDFDEKDGYAIWLPPAAAAVPQSPQDAPTATEQLNNDDDAMPMMPALRMVERSLKIKASTPVGENGAERRLNVRVPSAPTSRLELLVDLPAAQARLLGSETPVSVEPAGTGQTRISAEKIGGDMALFWGPKRTAAPAEAPVLKAEGLLEIAFGDTGGVKASALLTLQSFNEPFQVFTVNLPPGMRLAPSQTPDFAPEYEIIPQEPVGGEPVEARQRVLVRLRQPTIGPVKVRLDAAATPPSRDAEFIEVGGFEVDEAVEQVGRVSLIAAEGESVSWVESTNIVQSSDPLASGETEVAAHFRYFAQPFSLLVKAAPQKTRMRVEPTYLLEVFSDHIKLTANLAYQIHGAKASLVRLDLQGWKLDAVEGDDVSAAGVKFDQLAPLEIPFDTAVSGHVNVRVTAERIVEGANGSLRIPLPAPIADFAVSAVVAVAPNDNIQLTPLPEQMHGLIPEPPPSLNVLEITRKASLFYRTRTGEPQPVFAADYEVKKGEVTVEADGEIRLQPNHAAVLQEFAYNFAYEPVDRISLKAPREAFQRGELRLLFDEAPILPKVEDGGEAGEHVLLHVTPPMVLGRHTLMVEYAVPLPEIAPQQTISHSLPLAVPVGAGPEAQVPKMLSNALRVSSARPLQAAPDGDVWKLLMPRPGAAAREEVVLSADGPQEQLPLLITHQKSDEQLSNAVDRLWLQTWLTASKRRDHAAMQVTTHEDVFRVRLPPGADAKSLIIFLDGRRLSGDSYFIEGTAGGTGEVVLAIDLESVDSTPFALEFWYGYATRRAGGWPAGLMAPEFLDVSWVRQIYWQLVLPPDEHLVMSPAGFTSENVWRRSGWWWGREPTLRQSDLEQWSGATEQPSPSEANEYLFSSFGAPQAMEAYTIPGAAAILGWSGFVLVLGLLMLRAAPGRQRQTVAAVALVLSVAVIAAVAWLPETGVLAAQCGAIGAAGVAMAWFFGRLASRPAPRATTSSSISSFHSRMATSASTRSGRRPSPAVTPAGSPQDSSP
jgi:hypothetical protein